MDKQKLLNYALIALIALLIFQTFGNKKQVDPTTLDDLQITAPTEIRIGNAVALTLQNNTKEEIDLPSDCPNEPFQVSQYLNGEWVAVTAAVDPSHCLTEDFKIAPGARLGITYQPWQRDLFMTPGKYRVEIPVGAKTFLKEIDVVEPGIFALTWRTVFYRPIYNLLVLLIDFAGHSFGLGIVLLTILIRGILFIPFQRSLQSQRRLQKIQPQLDEIKKKYAENQQMVAMETMALMKKNNVSMFGSCLPLIIQMPFLIALYWVARDGLGENTLSFLYSFQSGFDLTAVNTHFLGLNLLAPGAQFYFALPIFLALTQFVQMKLALHHSKKTQVQKPAGDSAMADAMQSMNKMMPYFLPLMIGFFSFSLPAGVGVYWGTSTLFGIAQQFIVNRQIK
ncbi:MAG: YidC/Oxa1 family membrane protein insertase [Patescibacteria group bacterium]